MEFDRDAMNLFCVFSVLILLLAIAVISWTRDHDEHIDDRVDNDQKIMEEIILLERLDEEERD